MMNRTATLALALALSVSACVTRDMGRVHMQGARDAHEPAPAPARELRGYERPLIERLRETRARAQQAQDAANEAGVKVIVEEVPR